MGTKVCKKCKETKLLLEFNKESRAKEGYSLTCKSCKLSNLEAKCGSVEKFEALLRSRKQKKTQVTKKWTALNKEHVKVHSKQYRKEHQDRDRLTNKSWRQANSQKMTEYVKQYNEQHYFKNKEKVLGQKKQYHGENKEKILDQKKHYYKENKEKVNAKNKNRYCETMNDPVKKEKRLKCIREYEHKVVKINTEMMIRKRLRGRITAAIKKNAKTGSAVQDLGCSIAELKIYIESKFQPGMTWEGWSSRGGHLDHIRPLSSFNLQNPEEFKQAVHYTNLQPLWARDNLIKSDKWEKTV